MDAQVGDVGDAGNRPGHLAPHPSSVSEARRIVRAALDGTTVADHLDAAELCTSELVTNAVVHAGTPIDVRVVRYDGGLRVEVEDRSEHLPVPRHYVSLTATGRGLHLVEQLVTRWGVWPTPGAKTVWFELGAASGADGAEGAAGDAAAATAGAAGGANGAVRGDIAVTLLNTPLLLHGAWQIHAESLLREYLLVQIEGESLRGLESHAAASDAIALLERQVPAPRLDQDPEEVLAGAVEPLVSADRVVLEVPASSIAHFATLDSLLDAATRLADSGTLLTPPTQPEVRNFRRWVCGEVGRQAEGGAATPWDPEIRYDHSPSAPPLRWDPTEVDDAQAALLAADDTGAIVAVSPAALVALGYAERRDLVGRRLVEVIPPRFRQAHLAGVTMHLFAGRGPLLDHTVTVPALRADGTEVEVTMVVHSRQVPGGRRLFTAEIG